MIRIRPAATRGHADHGWLQSHHSFSFASYYDPEYMGYSVLRVINDDVIAPGTGFGMHPHRDMEIVTYVMSGAVRHQDSMGNQAVISAGEVQRMSAGTGVRHSEFNASSREPLHLLQIWLQPDREGHTPGYEQQRIDDDAKRGTLRLVASPDGADGSLSIHQDVRLYAALLDGEEAVRHAFAPGRRGYLHVARGSVRLQGQPLQAGDGAMIAEESEIRLDRGQDADILLFDLP